MDMATSAHVESGPIGVFRTTGRTRVSFPNPVIVIHKTDPAGAFVVLIALNR